MGPRRKLSTWPQEDLDRRVKIDTKRAKKTHNASANPPPAPVTKRSSEMFFCGLRPIFYAKETKLSTIYEASSPVLYINQVFDSVMKIGSGGFGDVYKGVSKEDDTMYAIKISNSNHCYINFSEVKKWEHVPKHENLIEFYYGWQEYDKLYMQMEYCMTSLDKVTSVYHCISESICWNIITDIAQGLKCLHELNFVHMDIKPANIMITTNGVHKIGDFGILKDISVNKAFGDCGNTEGDSKYLAAEVLRNNMVSKAADIFSFGMTMLEVASDADLPSYGPDWCALREGKLPDCYLFRTFTKNFRLLIESMIDCDATKRPLIEDIVNNPECQSISEKHSLGIRLNYLKNWERTWARLQAKLPNPPLWGEYDPGPRSSKHFALHMSRHKIEMSNDNSKKIPTARRLFN